MARSGDRDLKSGPGPLGTQAQQRAAATTTKTPNRLPHPSSLKLSNALDPLLPHLDSKGLACLLRVGIAVQPRAQQELNKRNQRDAKTVMDLTLQGSVSELHLMPRPNNPDNDNSYQISDERHLYLYQEKDKGLVFYYYAGGQDQNQQQKHYLHDAKQQEQSPVDFKAHSPVDFKAHSFDSAPGEPEWYCVDEALRKSVFDITSKRKHTLRSNSEEIRRMVAENGALPFVVYCSTKEEKDKIVRNAGGQRISLVGKTPLQVARGENNDYAINAMTRKLLDVKDEKQKQENKQKIQAQYDAQDAPGSAEEEQQKAKNKKNVLEAQKALTKAVLESKPSDIQDAGLPTCKLTLAETAGGAAIAAAVTQLEVSLEVVRNTVVRTGCHDNPELQLQAREEYDLLLDAGHDWQSAKMQFLFRNIGRYQRMMSLGYAHGFCGDGLRENVEKLQKGETPRESTKVRVWDSVSRRWSGEVGFYSVGGFGADFAIGSRWPAVLAYRCHCVSGYPFFSVVFKYYVNQKQQAHRPITQQQRDHQSDPPKSSCVM